MKERALDILASWQGKQQIKIWDLINNTEMVGEQNSWFESGGQWLASNGTGEMFANSFQLTGWDDAQNGLISYTFAKDRPVDTTLWQFTEDGDLRVDITHAGRELFDIGTNLTAGAKWGRYIVEKDGSHKLLLRWEFSKLN